MHAILLVQSTLWYTATGHEFQSILLINDDLITQLQRAHDTNPYLWLTFPVYAEALRHRDLARHTIAALRFRPPPTHPPAGSCNGLAALGEEVFVCSDG
jgi:hypothetical protein